MFATLVLRGLVVLALAATSAPAQLEPLFDPPIHPGVTNIRGATPGDVNEDGIPDLVVWSNSFSVMLGQADGKFAPPVPFNQGTAVAVKLADVDEDGHLDVVAVTALNGDLIRIAAGNGDGSFDPFVDLLSAIDLRDVLVADLDADGHLDLAAAGLHSSRVSVHLGHGDGTFEPKQDYGPIGDYSTTLTAADLTGDGVLDLAVPSGNDAQVALLHGDGDGTFTSAAPVPMPGGVEDVAATDLDDDGDLDLVVSMVSSFVGLRVAFNAGGGTFPGTVFGYALPSVVNSQLVVADFDEDGRGDVALGIGGSDHVIVFRATGVPGAAALELSATYLGGRSPQDLACADMDLDGDLDLVASNSGGHDLRILRGEGDGSFRTAAGSWALGLDPLGVATGDFDEDGRTDIVTCGDGAALAVTLNSGDGRFPTATGWPVPDGLRADALAADFNGDGHLDVATTNREFGTTSATIALGDGDGGLLAVELLTTGLQGTWRWIDAADFDVDGDLDLVLGASSGGSSIRVAFNDGDGGLSAGPLLDAELFGTTGVCTGDFDADGAPDIAVAHNTGPGRLTVFLGDGAGGFSRALAHESVNGGQDVATADLDGDGALDLVTTAWSGLLAVHLGQGDGSFGEPATYGYTPYATGLAIGDVDHDGILDVVTAEDEQFEDFGHLSVFIGQGDGSFQPAVRFLTGQRTSRVAIADFDGDGWNDLATAAMAGLDVMLNRRGPWNELGHGLAGVQGIPRQTGLGSLVPGQPFAFQLRDGKPLATAFHVVGLGQLMAPFKGGVMVPTIDFINGLAVTNAQGNVTLAGPWINAPSGLTLFFQFWQKDPAGPLGFAASTAVSGTTP